MKTAYEMLVAAVERAINEADPIGLLDLGAPSDEYAPEIGTIVPRLVNAQRVDEVTAVLEEEFRGWFGDDTASPRQAYEAPARRDLGSSTRTPKELLTRSSDSGCRAEEVELP